MESVIQEMLLKHWSLSLRILQVRCDRDTSSLRAPTPPSPTPVYGFSSHIRCKACHCLRATSNCKTPCKLPRTNVCLGLGEEGKPRRIAKPPGPWSLIVAPGHMSDSGHVPGQPLCSMDDFFYLQVTTSSLCGCHLIGHK